MKMRRSSIRKIRHIQFNKYCNTINENVSIAKIGGNINELQLRTLYSRTCNYFNHSQAITFQQFISPFCTISSSNPVFKSKFLRDINFQDMKDNDCMKLANLIRQAGQLESINGEIVPQAIVEDIRITYKTLSMEEKMNFLSVLAKELYIDTVKIESSLEMCQKALKDVLIVNNMQVKCMDWNHEYLEKALRATRHARKALVPFYELFFQQIIAQRADGMIFLVQMRADLLSMLGKNKNKRDSTFLPLRALETSLKTFVSAWFSVGFLELKRLTYANSSGELLEKIIRYEAVHPVGTITELKRRLGNSRRCFAFFHPSIPNEPLVFVHVALVDKLADSMQYIQDHTEESEESNANTAIFYSISSTQKGLSGCDLGNYLIKQVAKALKSELPQLTQFSTLSPMPAFIPWLQSHSISSSFHDNLPIDSIILQQLNDAIVEINGKELTNSNNWAATILSALEIPSWYSYAKIEAVLKPILLNLGVRYILEEKKRAKALCSVANFHLLNGAIFERINWLADLSPKGMKQSAGMMINYKYDLSQVETNNENYLLQNKIAVGQQPLAILNSPL